MKKIDLKHFYPHVLNRKLPVVHSPLDGSSAPGGMEKRLPLLEGAFLKIVGHRLLRTGKHRSKLIPYTGP